MLDKIKKTAFTAIEKASDLGKLEELRIKYLGRKGEVSKILRGLKDLKLDERRRIGPLAQKLKQELEEKIDQKYGELNIIYQPPTSEFFDITRPGHKIKVGHIHPLSKVDEEIRRIFVSLNFSVVEGPEIEDEYHNFDALNIPPDHPARDAWDTFWIKNSRIRPELHSRMNPEYKHLRRLGEGNIRNALGKLLLRTHTSPMQIRYMEKHKPPFQIIVPGRVFRYEATDASHEINFYQVEGLMVGEDISLANFKFIIEEFLKKFFKQKIGFRYRPSYFPFTEPSIEMDIKFKGKWLEIMGAGMVHRKVFEAVGYDPYAVSGFAFGTGLERLAMIKYNIPDIRLFYLGDLRFIEQF